jgi:hypothetical protein
MWRNMWRNMWTHKTQQHNIEMLPDGSGDAVVTETIHWYIMINIYHKNARDQLNHNVWWII